MRNMNKKIMVLWAVIVVMLLTAIFLIGYNKRDKKYIELEKKLNDATYLYLKNNDMIPETDESVIVFVSKLVEEEYIKYDEELEKYCIESITFTKGLVKDKYEIVKYCKDE